MRPSEQFRRPFLIVSKSQSLIQYFTLYRRKMCKISHFSTIERDFNLNDAQKQILIIFHLIIVFEKLLKLPVGFAQHFCKFFRLHGGENLVLSA